MEDTYEFKGEGEPPKPGPKDKVWPSRKISASNLKRIAEIEEEFEGPDRAADRADHEVAEPRPRAGGEEGEDRLAGLATRLREVVVHVCERGHGVVEADSQRAFDLIREAPPEILCEPLARALELAEV